MKLVLIPPGEFTMGAQPSEITDLKGKPPKTDEPQHNVRIRRPYYLGAYEVTQDEYEQVVQRNPSGFCRGGKHAQSVSGQDTRRFPVENVAWVEAKEFCKRLAERPEEKAAGRSYRLPTEAEWEYACRAGTQTEFAFGRLLSPT
jgi:formylglycine-generating enzyme required for sulfatase activity